MDRAACAGPRAARRRTRQRASARARGAAMPRLLSRPVEGAAVELARRAYELGAADLGQHAIERARIGLLLGDRPPHDAFGVALAVDREPGWIADADAGRKPLPFGFGRGEDLLGLGCYLEEAIDGRLVLGGPAPIEGEAEDRNRRLGAELLHHRIDHDRAL